MKACDVNKLSTWPRRLRAQRQGSSHFSAVDMHRQVGLLESSGKTQPAGSLVPALEIPLASPSCAPVEPQKHACNSRTASAQMAPGILSCSWFLDKEIERKKKEIDKACGNSAPSQKTKQQSI